MSTQGRFPRQPLRQYALVADGERGALVGPAGDVAFLCAPRWHDDAVFSGLVGGEGTYWITPHDARNVSGGYYEPGTLIWRSRWTTERSVIECREALVLPGARDRLVLLRRLEAHEGSAHVDVGLEVRAGFGTCPMTVQRTGRDVWEGRSGDVAFRWSGVPGHARADGGRVVLDLLVPPGGRHDFLLEIVRGGLPKEPPRADPLWCATEEAWAAAVPDLAGSPSPGESRHSLAILRGLTSSTGGMVAAASTSLPERVELGRHRDNRYAWIRNQAYVGQAAAAVGAHDLLDAAVSFVSDRVLADGPHLRAAYTIDGGPVPDPRETRLPGPAGAASVHVGNDVTDQFHLDALGEALLMLSAADRAGRLDGAGARALELLVRSVEQRWGEPDAGIWELPAERWAHSRLMCVAGLRAAAERRGGDTGAAWLRLAAIILESVDKDSRHVSGRWQRAPGDPRVDASLLSPAVRGAISADDPRHLKTVAAVIDDLADDGRVGRSRRGGDRPIHDIEGFVMSGLHLVLGLLATGRPHDAALWYERTRGALGPPGLFAEEFGVIQRQLRDHAPQAFIHALALETGHRLAEAGLPSRGIGGATAWESADDKMTSHCWPGAPD